MGGGRSHFRILILFFPAARASDLRLTPESRHLRRKSRRSFSAPSLSKRVAALRHAVQSLWKRMISSLVSFLFGMGNHPVRSHSVTGASASA